MTGRSPLRILVCGTLLLLISLGSLQTLGLFMAPVSAELGWGRGVLSFAIALQSLIWGIATPLAGAVADKYGPGRVLAVGGVVYATGLALMGFAEAPIDATISIGVFIGLGMSMTMFPIVLSIVGRVTEPAKRTLYLGIASAGGSSGMFILVPMGQFFIDWQGWSMALIMLAGIAFVMTPLAAGLAIGPPGQDENPSGQTLWQAVKEAGVHKGFILLTAGYFVCGFQTRFIGTHFPALLQDVGIGAAIGATALAVIGVFNMIGTFTFGWAAVKWRSKYLLAWLYLGRSIAMTAFFLLPITETSTIVFSIVIGFFWLATVPLTGAIVSQIFGPTYVATLYGITFFGHQLGSFLGVWLGGFLFDLTGNYDAIWWCAVALGGIACLMHFPIDDKPVMRAATI